MFEWLFPNWSNPLTITALVSVRIFLNVYLTVAVSEIVGRRTAYTATMGTATFLFGVLTILLLRPNGLALGLPYVESVLQVVLIAIAGYVVYSSPWKVRRIVTVLAIVSATALLVIMIPVYGERFVAR
ncbi:hypothetical protein ACOJIV_07725 [Haloarcula sp. AONF1]